MKNVILLGIFFWAGSALGQTTVVVNRAIVKDSFNLQGVWYKNTGNVFDGDISDTTTVVAKQGDVWVDEIAGVVAFRSSLEWLILATAGVTPGDKGDITVSATWEIDPNTVGESEITPTSVTPGTYTLATVAIDEDGRITEASEGTVTTYRDSVFLQQDSIVVSYRNGSEIGRDTIRHQAVSTTHAGFATPHLLNRLDVAESDIGTQYIWNFNQDVILGVDALETNMGVYGGSGFILDNSSLRNILSSIDNNIGAAYVYFPDESFPLSKLQDSGVTPGSYTNANITVSDAGIVTSASSGSTVTTYRDSVFLQQDSIVVSYRNGSEISRDTVRIPLKPTGVAPTVTGGAQLTIDIYGRVTNVDPNALTFTATGDVTSFTTNILGSGFSVPLNIAPGVVNANELGSTTVTPGTYSGAFTVDQDGRITDAQNQIQKVELYRIKEDSVNFIFPVAKFYFDSLELDAGLLDPGGNRDYAVNETGIYRFSFYANVTTTGGSTTNTRLIGQVLVNGVQELESSVVLLNPSIFSLNGLLNLAQGDVISFNWVLAAGTAPTTMTIADIKRAKFSIEKL